jgi:capsular polysaccharide transport system permease protein
VTSLEVQAFRPDDAQAIAVGVLDLAEQLVNQLNSRIQKDAVSSDEDEVKRDEARLTDAQIAITAFQNKETMIDPVNNSTIVSTLVGKLQGDLAQTQAQITDMAAGSPNNPGLSTLRRQADATRAQIDRERSRITSSEEGLADKLGQYQRLVLEREFATKALSVANTSLDGARADVRRKQLYIERIVEPNLSDISTMPQRSWITFTVLCINLLGVFIGWLVMSGVKEHVSSSH